MTVRLVALGVFAVYTLLLLAVGAQFVRTAMDERSTARRSAGQLIGMVGVWELLVGAVVVVDGAPVSTVLGPFFMGVMLLLGVVLNRKFGALFPEPSPRGVSLVKTPKPRWVPSSIIEEEPGE